MDFVVPVEKVITMLSGVKRDPQIALGAYGKRGKSEDSETKTNEQLAMVPFELAFSPEMTLEHLGGQIIKSPAKNHRLVARVVLGTRRKLRRSIL
ncbi:hypothetical protein ACLB2K_029241 [Fragaria x ananassa]